MKICIAVRKLQFYGEKAGQYQHVLQLVRHLALIDHQNHYDLFFNFFWSAHWQTYHEALRVLPQQENFSIRRRRLPAQFLDRLAPPMEWVLGHKIDVFHEPIDHFARLPRLLWGKAVLTIHDMACFRTPVALGKWAAWLRVAVPQSAQRAACIITVSQASKMDILEYLHVPEEKVVVIPNGVASHFRPLDDHERVSTVLRRYGVEQPYILFVGTLQPNKNIPTLLEAYALLRQSCRDAPFLVLAGQKGWLYEDIFTKMENLHLAPFVRFTGYVDEGELPALYSGATLFVMPSTFEGFGIPVIEAMACGVPVVCARAASLPEVAGEAAVFFDPHAPEAMAHALQVVLEDEEFRQTLRARGLQRAKDFSWEQTARRTLQVYETLSQR